MNAITRDRSLNRLTVDVLGGGDLDHFLVLPVTEKGVRNCRSPGQAPGGVLFQKYGLTRSMCSPFYEAR